MRSCPPGGEGFVLVIDGGSDTKKGAPNQGRSQDPDQGAQKNSTWPTLACGSAGPSNCLCWLQEPSGLKVTVFLEAELDARASNQICHRGLIRFPLVEFDFSGERSAAAPL